MPERIKELRKALNLSQIEFAARLGKREITYILRNAEEYGLKEGFCILALQTPGWDYIRPA